ncbi:MAG TPA: zinc ribbon domain-containing protein [Acidobacteriaceae bacterium]|jgi:hypothetical protein
MNGGGGYQVIGLLIAAAIAFWVYTDAKKRPMNAIGWAIGTFLLCIVFLPLYLIMRKPLLTAQLPPGAPPLPPGYTYTTTPPPGQAPPPTFTPPPPAYAPPPPAAAPPTAAPSGGPVHFCPQCGHKYEGTVKFCPNCGAATP